MEVVCVAKYLATKGMEYLLVERLNNLIPLTLMEDGCIRYELNQSMENAREIIFVEKWKNKKAFDEHCNKEYIKMFFNNGKPEFVDIYDVALYREIK